MLINKRNHGQMLPNDVWLLHGRCRCTMRMRQISTALLQLPIFKTVLKKTHLVFNFMPNTCTLVEVFFFCLRTSGSEANSWLVGPSIQRAVECKDYKGLHLSPELYGLMFITWSPIFNWKNILLKGLLWTQLTSESFDVHITTVNPYMNNFNNLL